MKIGLVAPIWYPIPPKGYGGIELVVHLLAEGLVERGHDVTLFASGDSTTKAKLVHSSEIAPSAKIGQVYPDLVHSLTAYLRASDFDVIHDHSGSIGPAIGAFCGTPVLHTLHGPATKESKTLYGMISPRVYFNAISEYQRRCFGDLNFIDTIYNAIDLESYPFSAANDGYLLFVGRMNEEKGAHLAVDIANRLGERLIIVAKMVEPAEKQYFNERVKPLIKENTEVIGEIDINTKAELYKNAKCTLFPIQWPEPFGLVMIESMAAGTPVAAVREGAVAEVIIDGKTGFIVECAEDMIEAVKRIGEINPMDCRAYVEERFSTGAMVTSYEKAYKRILDMEAEKRELRRAG